MRRRRPSRTVVSQLRQRGLDDDPFFAEVDRFLRVSARERQGLPSGAVRDAFSDLVDLVHDRTVATRLVAFHGSAEDAIEAGGWGALTLVETPAVVSLTLCAKYSRFV
jgi:hypothetical protein